mmetsp:Transcript_57305/g.138560  ORF Transcript_57305/g.138560 Transcript_57305/m.138560 type:complete len:200 (-) Transcript_57305:293-892(-)
MQGSRSWPRCTPTRRPSACRCSTGPSSTSARRVSRPSSPLSRKRPQNWTTGKSASLHALWMQRGCWRPSARPSSPEAGPTRRPSGASSTGRPTSGTPSTRWPRSSPGSRASTRPASSAWTTRRCPARRPARSSSACAAAAWRGCWLRPERASPTASAPTLPRAWSGTWSPSWSGGGAAPRRRWCRRRGPQGSVASAALA